MVRLSCCSASTGCQQPHLFGRSELSIISASATDRTSASNMLSRATYATTLASMASNARIAAGLVFSSPCSSLRPGKGLTASSERDEGYTTVWHAADLHGSPNTILPGCMSTIPPRWAQTAHCCVSILHAHPLLQLPGPASSVSCRSAVRRRPEADYLQEVTTRATPLLGWPGLAATT